MPLCTSPNSVMAPKKAKASPTKRKADAPPADEPADKASKHEEADDAAAASHVGDPVKAMRFLLSDDSLELITDDEVGDEKQRSYRVRPGQLSAFEELISAMLLAKPISHRLGCAPMPSRLFWLRGEQTARDQDAAERAMVPQHARQSNRCRRIEAVRCLLTFHSMVSIVVQLRRSRRCQDAAQG